jgi:hypothetical protein
MKAVVVHKDDVILNKLDELCGVKPVTNFKSDLVEIKCHLHRQTEKAILVSEDGDKDKATWFPKSQITWVLNADKTVIMDVPEWLLEAKDWA